MKLNIEWITIRDLQVALTIRSGRHHRSMVRGRGRVAATVISGIFYFNYIHRGLIEAVRIMYN